MASLCKTFILFLLLLPQNFAISVFAATGDGGGGGGGGAADMGDGAPGPNQLVGDGRSSDYAKAEIETNFVGEWVLDNPDVGVGAMQLQLMPNDQVVWYDATSVGPSARKLEPQGNCPINPDANNQPDCYAHALAYDWKTTKSRTIVLSGEPWCSSGNLWPNGNFVATGGSFSGVKAVRMLPKDDLNADFIEKKDVLADFRWYSSNQILEDGSAIVVGGRGAFSYEIVPPQLEFEPKRIELPFLQQTRAPAKGPNQYIENNLYPFLFLLPDGNVFLFANDRAITFAPTTGEIVQQHPVCPGGSRNYPPSGSSAILPLKLGPDNSQPLNVEIVICGGNSPNAFEVVDGKNATEKEYVPALKDCHRIHPMNKGATWEEEQDMPSPRIMADLLHLPTGDLLMINGAKKGTSGWEDATDPNFTPLLYTPFKPMGYRFKELKPATIARMYHSTSALLPDTKILVAGSNPHQFYTFNVEFPTELRVEKFSPHYLDPTIDGQRPIIDEQGTDKVLKYGKPFKIAATLQSEAPLVLGEIKVTMLYPPFTTHGFSQNQRLIVPAVMDISDNVITALAPPSGKIAPPGYYILFVNNLGVPGGGIWVHID
ncbi:aldehyde oxidase GLOX-like [Cynara cardunculus var. scolymus]|uniref:aldehyde oxidase GLOX-like n=1 Tax=Cynara cardunculus var. scolymus TaxID=59895 RepID=UPI000D63104E|nr:aldehyde oxidase GLOX-like [Cynara cardunculus var. scolymus]